MELHKSACVDLSGCELLCGIDWSIIERFYLSAGNLSLYCKDVRVGRRDARGLWDTFACSKMSSTSCTTASGPSAMKWGTVVDVIVFGMIERIYQKVLLRSVSDR